MLAFWVLSRAVCVQQGAPFWVQRAPGNRAKPGLTTAWPLKGPRSKPKHLQKGVAETKTPTDKAVKTEKLAFVLYLVVSFFVCWPFGSSQGPAAHVLWGSLVTPPPGYRGALCAVGSLVVPSMIPEGAFNCSPAAAKVTKSGSKRLPAKICFKTAVSQESQKALFSAAQQPSTCHHQPWFNQEKGGNLWACPKP